MASSLERDKPIGRVSASATADAGQPIQKFGSFFKNYALGLSLVVAALPLAAVKLDVIPQFDSMKPLLAILGSGSSFFLVSVIFARRHGIARLFFPGWQRGNDLVARAAELKWAGLFAWLPFVLVFVAIVAIVSYVGVLNGSVQTIAYRSASVQNPLDSMTIEGGAAARCASQPSERVPLRFIALVSNFGSAERIAVTCSRRERIDAKPGDLPVLNWSVEFFNNRVVDSIRTHVAAASIPHDLSMSILFFIAFAAASAAFVLTGLKDYLQRDIGFTDRQLIQQQISQNRMERFDVEGVPDLYGTVEYTPGYPEFATPSRPLCKWHHVEPIPGVPDPTTGKMKWIHGGDGHTVKDCFFTSSLTLGEIDRRFRQSWEATVRGSSGESSSDPETPLTTKMPEVPANAPPVVAPPGATPAPIVSGAPARPPSSGAF